MKFSEIVDGLREGRCYRRPEWLPPQAHVKIDSNVHGEDLLYCCDSEFDAHVCYNLTRSELSCDDWVEYHPFYTFAEMFEKHRQCPDVYFNVFKLKLIKDSYQWVEVPNYVIVPTSIQRNCCIISGHPNADINGTQITPLARFLHTDSRFRVSETPVKWFEKS